MILFPAIDLKGGQCVRLVKGDMAQATVFNTDPADQARQFRRRRAPSGCISSISTAPLPGHRSMKRRSRAFSAPPPCRCNWAAASATSRASRAWLKKGVARVILGTVALKNPDLVNEACRSFPGKIAVGIDAKGGKVAVEGWAETSELTALDLARRFEDAGVAAIIYTDIDRDGLLQGVNVTATAELAAALAIPVIASGGVSSLG